MRKVALGDLIEPSNVQRAGRGDYPILSMTMHEGLVDQSAKFKKRVASNDLSGYKVVTRGQLVVGFPIDEGVLDFQMLYDTGIVSPAYGVWDLTNPSCVHIHYLKRFLRSSRALTYYKTKLRGSTARRRSLPTELFLALPVPLPSVEEQRRIAELLNRADLIRIKRGQILAHLDSLIQSIFYDMFANVSDRCQFSDTCERITVGVVIKPASHYTTNGIPALRTLNVKPGRIDLNDLVYFSKESNDGPLAKSKLRTGDVVIARTGKAGVAATVPPSLSGANAIDLIVATPNRQVAIPTYLEALLNSEFGKRIVAGEARGQIQKHFNVGSLKAALVPIPPLAHQRVFMSRAEATNLQRQLVQRALDADKELCESLQARAFRGEL